MKINENFESFHCKAFYPRCIIGFKVDSDKVKLLSKVANLQREPSLEEVNEVFLEAGLPKCESIEEASLIFSMFQVEIMEAFQAYYDELIQYQYSLKEELVKLETHLESYGVIWKP